MALSWINFNNGDVGLDIRNAINAFNTFATVDVNANTLDIVALYNSVAANLVKINTNIADIATNVSDISDLDVRVTSTEGDVVNLLDPDFTDYVPQGTKPAYQEGRSFFTDECKDMCIYTDITDVAISLGQQTAMRVVNNTGSTITKGQLCTYAGASGGFPLIKLAIADSFTNAILLGMAYHDIPNGTTGILITHGKVTELNTDGKTAGVPYYLSDTIPGAMTLVPGNLVSQIGGATDISLTDGVFQVNVRNNVMLPKTIGVVSGAPINTYNLTTIPQNVVNYTDDISIITPVSKVDGTLQAVQDGLHRVSFTATFDFSSIASTRVIYFQAYNVTQTTVLGAPMAKSIPRDATEDYFSVNAPIELLKDDVIVMRVSALPDMSVSFSAMAFDLESLHLRG